MRPASRRVRIVPMFVYQIKKYVRFVFKQRDSIVTAVSALVGLLALIRIVTSTTIPRAPAACTKLRRVSVFFILPSALKKVRLLEAKEKSHVSGKYEIEFACSKTIEIGNIPPISIEVACPEKECRRSVYSKFVSGNTDFWACTLRRKRCCGIHAPICIVSLSCNPNCGASSRSWQGNACR